MASKRRRSAATRTTRPKPAPEPALDEGFDAAPDSSADPAAISNFQPDVKAHAPAEPPPAPKRVAKASQGAARAAQVGRKVFGAKPKNAPQAPVRRRYKCVGAGVETDRSYPIGSTVLLTDKQAKPILEFLQRLD